MKNYWIENNHWIAPTLDLIQLVEFVRDTPYRDLFVKQFPHIAESGLDYECVRMWKLGRSIIENGYQPATPIRVEQKDGKTVIRDGWHRLRVLRALEIELKPEAGSDQVNNVQYRITSSN